MAFTLCMMLTVTSCEHSPAVNSHGHLQQWPETSEHSYVQYVERFSSPTELGIEKGTWNRFVEFFTGSVTHKIVRPMDIAVDNEGTIYVVDPGISGVHVFNRNKNLYKVLRLKDDAPLPSPVSISLGLDNQIFVSDSQLGHVFSFTPGEKHLSPLNLDIHIHQPTGLAYDKILDRLYITDTKMHRIIAVSSRGRFIREYGVRGANKLEFNYPTYLAVDDEHRLYVTDSLNFRVQILDQNGAFISMFGKPGDATGNLSRPKGVSIDSDGHIYIVDGLFNSIQIFNKSGHLLMPVGERGNDTGQFWLPTGIHIDANDFIYVADSHNQRVQILRYLRRKPQ